MEEKTATFYRRPKMELSKPDLLQLLGVLEGELQAREIVVAILKAEQVKQLLYPKRKSGNGNDPWAALHRDCLGAFDASFDEASVKNLYGMQLSQLENLIKQYKTAQAKLKQQLKEAEQRCEKLLAELEDEKRKHAQDTAQGDDVTYLLEKERERLHQENEFEKQQNRNMEKDNKCLADTLEQERQRQKQIVLLLLAERKRLIYRYAEEKQKCDRLSQILCDEKGRIADMVDGLEEESKKSLQMEAELERQLTEFEVEREQFKSDVAEVEAKNDVLMLEVQRLQEELEVLQKQSSLNAQAHLGEGVRSTVVTMVSAPAVRAVPTISPTVSPPRNVAQPVSPKVGLAPATPAKPLNLITQTSPKLNSSKSLSASFISSTTVSPMVHPELKSTKMPKSDVLPILTSPVDNALLQGSQCIENSLQNDSNASSTYAAVKVTTPSTAHKGLKKMPLGRGAPPPIPPNKPVLPPQALHRKDTSSKPPIPPRSETVSEVSPDKSLQRVNTARYNPSPKATSEDASNNIASSEKNDISNEVHAASVMPGSEVLGQELADFQQILVSMASASSKFSSSANNSNQ